MVSLRSSPASCKRCGSEVDTGANACPECNYNPKEKGLRVAMAFFMAVVVLMTITMLIPRFGGVFVLLAGLAFLLAFVTFFVAFFATPSRFGSLFLRF
jgi:predicted nucleic acid-binding Zn ribbon protein